MSQPREILYNLTLKHLTKDGTRAGADLPEAQLNYISAKQLRALLDAVATTAPSVTPPAEPEVRISAPDAKFVVQVKGGQLNLVSWSSKQRGGQYTAERIVSIITGAEQGPARRASAAVAGGGGGGGDKLTMILLILAIIGVNGFTLWFVTRPKKTLMPKYTLLSSGPAERVLSSVAGNYETGPAPGDRRLQIEKTGSVQRYKLGTDHVLTTPQTFTVQAAEAAGRQALVTSRKAMITIRDPDSLVLYGDTYKRVAR